MDVTKHNAAIENNVVFAKALPYMEKAIELNRCFCNEVLKSCITA
jgi:hypothetical protein